jgi:hypothetical protein
MTAERQITHGPILVFGWYNFEIYQEASARALEQLGLPVIRLSCNPCFNGKYSSWFQRRLALGPAIKKLNRQLIQTVEKHKPRITLIYNNHYVKPKTLKYLREITWLAGYTNDNPFGNTKLKLHWINFRKTIPLYDNWHVIRESNINQFKAAGAKNVKLLMSYYLPWQIDDTCIKPRKDFENDIVFIGHAEPDSRLEYIKQLIKNNLKIKIFGPPKGWKKHLPDKTLKKIPPIHPIYGHEYRQTIRKSKIALVFLSNINRDTYTRRCFEIPAWGGFMLAPRTKTLQSLYEQGREADFFSTPTELVDKCSKYLQNDKLREEIAQKGQKKCLSASHDVISRMKQWLNDIKQFQSSKEK